MQGGSSVREGSLLSCFEVVSVIGNQESDQATYHVTRHATAPGLPPDLPTSLVMKVIFNYDEQSGLCPFEYEERVLRHLPYNPRLLPFYGSFCDVINEKSIWPLFMPHSEEYVSSTDPASSPSSKTETTTIEPFVNKYPCGVGDRSGTCPAKNPEMAPDKGVSFTGTRFEALSHRNLIPPVFFSQVINGGVRVKCFLYAKLNTLSDIKYQGLPAERIKDYIVQVLLCLRFIHSNLVFHTTLRLNSFFVTQENFLQIGGFDRADVVTVNPESEHPNHTENTTAYAIPAVFALPPPCSLCSTVHPSQCISTSLPSKLVDLSRAELWGVGAILFHLLLNRQYTPEDRHLLPSELLPPESPPELANLLNRLLTKDINLRPTVCSMLQILGIQGSPPLNLSVTTPHTVDRLTAEAISVLHTPHARLLLEESLRLDETFIPAILALRAMRLYFPRNFNWPSADAAFKDHIGMLNRKAQGAPPEAQKQAEHYFSRDPSSLGWFVVKASWLRNVRHNSAEAANVASIAASRGYAPAQAWLGVCYEHGSGVRKDIEEAARLYKCAADQNLAQGQCWLGVCHENGRGVEKNVYKAVRLYTLAASEVQGLAQALCCLGVCYENGIGVTQNPEEAVRLYRLAAERGLARALCCLGVCYANGKGVQKDIPEAVKYYKLSAENGYPRAQFYLAQRHDAGDGIPRDTNEAIKLYSLAADQGHGQSLMRLGLCYENGHGVSKDIREAIRLWKYAIDQGATKATEHLNNYINTTNTTPQQNGNH
ncbi:sel1 repeat family protein [Pelomyxa schiedti]|nr:sel1 repeat family protein [Pelomyxa schiedti]